MLDMQSGFFLYIKWSLRRRFKLFWHCLELVLRWWYVWLYFILITTMLFMLTHTCGRYVLTVLISIFTRHTRVIFCTKLLNMVKSSWWVVDWNCSIFALFLKLTFQWFFVVGAEEDCYNIPHIWTSRCSSDA